MFEIAFLVTCHNGGSSTCSGENVPVRAAAQALSSWPFKPHWMAGGPCLKLVERVGEGEGQEKSGSEGTMKAWTS